jgi:hypothetical protein
MIFPNQITTYVADRQLPWEYVWLEFDGLRVKSLLDTIGLSLEQIVVSRSRSERVCRCTAFPPELEQAEVYKVLIGKNRKDPILHNITSCHKFHLNLYHLCFLLFIWYSL